VRGGFQLDFVHGEARTIDMFPIYIYLAVRRILSHTPRPLSSAQRRRGLGRGGFCFTVRLFRRSAKRMECFGLPKLIRTMQPGAVSTHSKSPVSSLSQLPPFPVFAVPHLFKRIVHF
jgi:hypothetical protein